MSDVDHTALLALVEAVHAVERELVHRRQGVPEVVRLTETERLVMRYVDAHPGAAAGTVAQGTRLLRSNLSHAARSLEAKGLVVREPDPHDARVAHLYPTPLAATNLDRLQQLWVGAVADALPSASAGDVGSTTRLLESLADRLAERRDQR